MPILLGGAFATPVLIPWTLQGTNYRHYLSVSPQGDSFYVTIKDNQRADGSWRRISAFCISAEGELLDSGTFVEGAAVTLNLDDWRKSEAHSYAANPSGSTDVCINQFAQYVLVNIQEEDDDEDPITPTVKTFYQFNPAQLVENVAFESAILSTGVDSAVISRSDLDSSGATCAVGEPQEVEASAFSLDNPAGIILAIACAEVKNP